MHIVTATAPGATHTNPGQPGKTNNQDSVTSRTHPKGVVVVLCDGCGSQPCSGTGADIGANVIAQVVREHVIRITTPEELNWKAICKEVISSLRTIIATFTSDSSVATFEQAVVTRFLFTAMVLVTIDDIAVVASFGDGVVIVDDELILLEPPILNSPPYIGYLLLKESAYHTTEMKPHLGFSVVRVVTLSELKEGLIVGTDGLEGLADEDLHHPALAQPKSLQRWLNVQTAERIHDGTFLPGKCQDDVSLVLVRTEEAQKRLVEGRREIVELKQELARLQSEITTVTEKLKRTKYDRDEIRSQVDRLESELETIGPKAEKTEEMERMVSSLNAQVAKMRTSLPRKAKSLLSAVDDFFTALGFKGPPNGTSNSKSEINPTIKISKK